MNKLCKWFGHYNVHIQFDISDFRTGAYTARDIVVSVKESPLTTWDGIKTALALGPVLSAQRVCGRCGETIEETKREQAHQTRE